MYDWVVNVVCTKVWGIDHYWFICMHTGLCMGCIVCMLVLQTWQERDKSVSGVKRYKTVL